MSIVAPNGQVRLFKDVPLDDKFEDTLWFESKQAQTNYFLSLTPVHTMYNATRVRDGVIAVDVGEDSIRDCNYLMFQNMNFSDKCLHLLHHRCAGYHVRCQIRPDGGLYHCGAPGDRGSDLLLPDFPHLQDHCLL